jgi:hypothetical protein
MLRFAFSLFLLSALPAMSEPLDRFSGRYRGCAVSGGESVPIDTTLAVSGSILSGTYLFIESTGRTVSGRISLGGQDGDNRLVLRWSDLYGEGPAVFDFTSDGTRFDGYWAVDSGDRRFAWYGVRADSGLPAPDCRVPVS